MRVTVKELTSGILVEFDKSFAIVRKRKWLIDFDW